MKILYLSVSLFACSFILFLSGCNNNDEISTTYPLDTSLAGSVFIDSRQITKIKGTFDENSLENFQSNESVIGIGKVSDEEIHLFCHTKWGDEWIDFSSEAIPLSGEPYNVNFDYSSRAKVMYNTTEWQTVSASINGWIKRVGFDDARNVGKSNYSLGDPPTFHYACDINISCILNGKKLTLNISSIAP
ncbi:MAG: hypothetical protein PHG06_17585 [Parabacteroides sp.]|nr:hypothetical protein [Parabacteroides sp.]